MDPGTALVTGGAKRIGRAMVERLARDAAGFKRFVADSRAAEQVSADALVGRADINDVVMAVGNAEMGLQMVTGLRDRIIEAYQEIMRMPI